MVNNSSRWKLGRSYLTAIASGRAPDVCTNIFSGFAAQLVEIDQLVEFDKLEGFDEVVEKKKNGKYT